MTEQQAQILIDLLKAYLSYLPAITKNLESLAQAALMNIEEVERQKNKKAD
jgi:hypothetical protein